MMMLLERRDGPPGLEVWEFACGIGLVPGVISFSPSNTGHHGMANPRRAAFHGYVASLSLPETRSTYYSLLLKLLFANQGL